MSIQSEIERLNNAKTEIAEAISEKGVEVSEGTSIDEFPSLVRSIPSGGSTEEIAWVDATFDLATMSISYLSHTYQEMVDLIGQGKAIKCRVNPGIGIAFGDVVFYNVAERFLLAQVMVQNNFGDGLKLYYFSVIVTEDRYWLTPYIINTTAMGG